MIPRSYAMDRAQDLAAALLSASSPPQILAACSAVEEFLRGDPANQARLRPFFSIAFPALICRLFGFDGSSPSSSRSPSISSAWIDQADREVSTRVFDLLSTRGILFSSISNVDRQSAIKFVFPAERLPEWMRFALQSENHFAALPDICPLFKFRVSEDAIQGAFQIQLNVFEYFIFWFAYYPVCRGKSENSSALAARKSRRFNLENWTSSWPSLSSSGSRPKKGCDLYPKLLYEYLRTFVPKNNRPSSCQPYRSSLFHRSSIYDDSASLQAEFMIHTLVHFWMVDNDFSPLPQSVSSLPLQPLMAETPPTPGLAPSLQLLVTYLNSSLSESSDLGENSTGSWNSLIQRPLYRFILRTFLFCPIEASMENVTQVISLWISYLQPWETSQDPFLELQKQEDEQGKTTRFSHFWKGYVASNYLFYNSLFVHFLGFAHKLLHADVEKMVVTVLKVMNVMTSSREMMILLKDMDAAYRSKPASASSNFHAIRQQLQDWEYGLCESDVDGSFLHENWNRDLRLFSDDEDGAHWLLQLFVLRAESEIQVLPKDNFARSLRDVDAIRARMSLLFDGLVKRPRCQPVSSSRVAQVQAEGFSPKHPGGANWADVKYRGDWMKRPISEGEVAWLADLLVNVSGRLNRWLGLDQGELGDEPAIVDLGSASGAMESVRMLLALGACWLGFMGRMLAHYLRKRGVRINLRPLASKKLVLVVMLTALAAVLRRMMGWA